MTKRIFIVFGCLMLGPGFAYAGPVTSEPDAERGLALAERLCTNCHLVKAGQEHANVDVPSFREIANKAAGTIMGRIVLPSHPMPEIPLTTREIADLAAYMPI